MSDSTDPKHIARANAFLEAAAYLDRIAREGCGNDCARRWLHKAAEDLRDKEAIERIAHRRGDRVSGARRKPASIAA
jgi:hypothetical protein